jgi:hypothetical protein
MMVQEIPRDMRTRDQRRAQRDSLLDQARQRLLNYARIAEKENYPPFTFSDFRHVVWQASPLPPLHWFFLACIHPCFASNLAL